MKKIDKDKSPPSSSIKVKWIDGLQFVATDDMGHSIRMDVSKLSGGEDSGFSPMQLLLVALGGCTGMDIMYVMKKQRQLVNNFEVLVSGERVKNPPQVYKDIEVVYKIKGKNLQEKAVKRAIKLSEDKYCSVRAMLNTKVRVVSRYIIQSE